MDSIRQLAIARPSTGIDSDDDRAALDVVDAILEGGPLSLPVSLRSCQAGATEDTIKVCHYGGYEHFKRDRSQAANATPVIFRWTGRTRIAE
jgi:hypothetical protein